MAHEVRSGPQTPDATVSPRESSDDDGLEAVIQDLAASLERCRAQIERARARFEWFAMHGASRTSSYPEPRAEPGVDAAAARRKA
jgi:hypothetical protein